MQQRIIEQLLDNRSVNDHELTQLLAVVESGNGAGRSSNLLLLMSCQRRVWLMKF